MLPHINAHGHLIVCMEMLRFSYVSTNAVPQQRITQQNTGQNIFSLQKTSLWAGKPILAVPRCLVTLLRNQISHPPFGYSSIQRAEICCNKVLQLRFLSPGSSDSLGESSELM